MARALRLSSFTSGGRTVQEETAMALEEQVVKMTKAINQAIKVMGDRFGSTEGDVERAIQDLKASLQTSA
jgi:hypothetical protein